MVEFIQAASKELFIQKLDTLKQGIDNGEYIDNELALYTSTTACFWLRRVFSPIFSLFGVDLFGSFRANAVAQSILQYSQANKDFLDDNLMNQKVFSIIDVLAGKVQSQEQKDAMSGVKKDLSAILHPAQVPAPAAPVAPPPAAAASAEPAHPPAEVPVPPAVTETPLPAPQAAAPEAPLAAPQADASAPVHPAPEEPAAPATVEVAPPAAPPEASAPSAPPAAVEPPQVVALASAVDAAAAPALQPTDAPQAAVPIHESGPVPAAPLGSSPAMQSLFDGEMRLNVQDFAFNVQQQLAKSRNVHSYSFSPVGLAHILGTMVRGSDESTTALFLKNRGLTGKDPVQVQQSYLKMVEAADTKSLDIATAVIASHSVKPTSPEKMVAFLDALDEYSVVLHEPHERTSARRITNMWLEDEAGIKKVTLDDQTYGGTEARKINWALLNVASIRPTLEYAPADKIAKHAFKFSALRAVEMDFFGFSQVKVLEKDSFKMVVLPYKSEDGKPSLKKVILLPNEGVSDFNDKLEPQFVTSCLEQYDREAKVSKVYLPKMNYEKISHSLLQTFEKLKVPVKVVAENDITSVIQITKLSETMPEVKPEASSAEKNDELAPLFIDRAFYYFVMNGDDVVLQGRVDDAEAFGMRSSKR